MKVASFKSLFDHLAVKAVIVFLLVLITFINTFLKFDGNWTKEIIFLVAQLYYSIYGGFYAYLFEKSMAGRFSKIDFISDDHENKNIRTWWLFFHTVIFTLIQMR